MHKIKLDNGKFKYIESYTGLDGKRHRVSITKNNQTKATEKQAYEELQNKVKEKLRNTDNKTLGYYIDLFLKTKKVLSPNTYVSYRSSFCVIDKDILLKNINKTYIEELLINLRKKYKIGTIKLIKTHIQALFIYINEYHDKSFNLNIKFTITKDDKIQEKSKIKFIETNKINEILDTIECSLVKDFATVQLHTGLRVGELLAITKNDIDWENNILSVTKTKQGDNTLTTPKTIHSFRKIEISQRVKNILLTYVTNDKFLFNRSSASISYHLRKLNLSSHMFRHTHVALLIEAGIPIKVISERLGHADTTITLNIYTHVTENMKIDLKSKLEKLGTF